LLVFASRRKGGHGKKLKNGQYMDDIYYSVKQMNLWQEAENLGGSINTKSFESAPNISADGKLVYYYRFVKLKKAKKKDGYGGLGDIYLAKIDGKNWVDSMKLPESINTEHWESDPFISRDGKTLFFVSDMPGGFGAKDIYYSTQDENGNWTAAKNIGDSINTEFNEVSPFLHPNGEWLYFSSDGYPGMGGYDIFVSTLREDGKWSIPQNIGYPINDYGNDLYFRIGNYSADTIYISSVQESGKGGLDIYMVILMPGGLVPGSYSYISERPISPTEEELVLSDSLPEDMDTVITEIEISQDEEDSVLMEVIMETEVEEDSVLMKVIMETEDEDRGAKEPKKSKRDRKSRKAKIVLKDKEEEREVEEDSISTEIVMETEDREERELDEIIMETKMEEEKEDNIDFSKLESEGAVMLNDILFDFDKIILRAESKIELNELVQYLQQHPEMNFEIAGHTDSYGSDFYNITLSQKRAKSAVNYLANQGINKQQLFARGYGESNPALSNDTEGNRQMNRRVEFNIMDANELAEFKRWREANAKRRGSKISDLSKDGLVFSVQVGAYPSPQDVASKFPDIEVKERIGEDGLYKYTTGNFNTLREAMKHRTEIVNKGYTDAFVPIYYNDERISYQQAKELFFN